MASCDAEVGTPLVPSSSLAIIAWLEESDSAAVPTNQGNLDRSLHHNSDASN